MNSIQQFKTRTGTSFPTYGEVLRIAAGLGYRKSYLATRGPAEERAVPRGRALPAELS